VPVPRRPSPQLWGQRRGQLLELLGRVRWEIGDRSLDEVARVRLQDGGKGAGGDGIVTLGRLGIALLLLAGYRVRPAQKAPAPGLGSPVLAFRYCCAAVTRSSVLLPRHRQIGASRTIGLTGQILLPLLQSQIAR
jgi:hypothetical protein